MTSLKMRLCSGLALPVSVFTMVSWTWSSLATYGRFVVSHWGSWRIYHVWEINENVTIFIRLVAYYMRAISWYMSLFLVLETMIFFVWHHSNCGKLDDHSCKLLCSIKLLHFWDAISEHLRSLFIDAGSKTMGILQSFDKDSDGSNIS